MSDPNERLLRVALYTYWEDFTRIEKVLMRDKRPFAGKSGKENSQLRGLIAVVLDANEIRKYTKIHEELCAREFGDVDIFDPVFARLFSLYQSNDSDRARVVSLTAQGKYELLHDSTIRNEAGLGDAKMKEIFPEATIDYKATANKLGLEEYLQMDESYVYERLLGDVFRGSEAKRIETALNLSLGLEKRVVVTRQSVVPDQSDKVMSSDGHRVALSHLGTSEVIELGPKGILKRIRLRTKHEPDPDQVIGRVWGDAGCTTLNPVVCQMQTYRFDEEARRVIPEESRYLTTHELSSLGPSE